MSAVFVRAWYEGLSAPEQNLILAVVVLALGIAIGAFAASVTSRLLRALKVDDAVKGTPFERTAQQFGSSTVTLLGQLVGAFVFFLAALYSIRTIGLVPAEALIEEIGVFLPRLFVAILVIVVGLVVADKAELLVTERFKGIKVPEVTLISTLLKLSILYVAVLIALSQLGVATGALLILLAAYAFGIFFLGGLAFKDLLASAAAGVYLLLHQPYAIGDTIEIGDHRGIVQEIDIFVTRIEDGSKEYIIPNRMMFTGVAIRLRE